jgi:hypothetical protein
LAALITSEAFPLPTAAAARTPARRVAGGHDERLARRLTTCYNYGHPRYSDCMHARLSGSRHHNGFVILLHPSCGGYIGVFFFFSYPGRMSSCCREQGSDARRARLPLAVHHRRCCEGLSTPPAPRRLRQTASSLSRSARSLAPPPAPPSSIAIVCVLAGRPAGGR